MKKLKHTTETNFEHSISGYRDLVRKAIDLYYPEFENEGVDYIGQGSYAYAYKVANLVFKVTRDRQDAEASLRVKGKQLKHIVSIKRVFKLSEINRWLIVSEFVPYELAEDEKYEELAVELDRVHTSFSKHIFWGEPKENTSFKFYLTKEVTDELKVFFEELIDNEFTNADLNENNVRVGEDGLFKLVDLGHMTSARTKEEVQFEELLTLNA